MPNDLKKNIHLISRKREDIKIYQRELLKQMEIRSEIESSLNGIISTLHN